VEWGKLSYSERKLVVAMIVKDRMIISDGFNGTPPGCEHFCEDDEGYTKCDVLHAEAIAILTVASSGQSFNCSTLDISLSSCKECSKLIHQACIVRVVYKDGYKYYSGLEFLRKAGIDLVCISDLTA